MANVAGHVELVFADERVEQLAAALADVGLEGQDPARREDLADDLAVPAVLRRVLDDEEGAVLLLTLDRHAAGAGEALEVVVGSQDVGVAGQGPEFELLVVVDRHLVAQPTVGRVRVAKRVVVVRIELEHAPPVPSLPCRST